jgi:hypothetical protein
MIASLRIVDLLLSFKPYGPDNDLGGQEFPQSCLRVGPPRVLRIVEPANATEGVTDADPRGRHMNCG